LEDKIISIALISPFVILIIQYCILICFNLLRANYSNIIQIISKLIVGIFFIYAFPAVIKRGVKKIIFTYLIAIIIFLFNFLLFPNNRIYLVELIFPFFFMCLPVFIYSMSLMNWNIFKEIMRKSSYIIIGFGVLIYILILLGKDIEGSYSMALSYYMLLPSIIFLDDLLYRFSFLKLFYLSLPLIIILTVGSRGAILCFLVFGALRISRFYFKFTYKNVVLYMLSFSFILSAIIFFKKIIEMIYAIFLNVGVKSRTMSLFLNNKVDYSSGREDIYSILLEKIKNNPIIGTGLGGDRLIIGGYAHNFLLEIITNFGIFIGGILATLMFLFLIKSLLISDKRKYNMIIIWFSMGFVHLMVSSSYLTDIKFWIFAGLMIKMLFNNNSEFSLVYP